MIHVVTIHNQHLYARQLDEMFRMRHEFYVKQRGWDALTSENERETDEFDNEHAVYLMNLDRFGNLIATFRINPTTTPYLLADKMPDFLDRPAPRSEEIWDLTRWMVAPHARRKSAGEIADAQKVLICGVMEFAVARGITHYTCLMDTVFVQRMARVWPVEFIGAPQRFEDGDGEAVAVLIEAGPHILATSRDKTGIYDAVLFELQTSPPDTPSERSKRNAALEKESPMTETELTRVREAARHLVTELKTQTQPDLEASIQAIDDFTRVLRADGDTARLENA